MNVVVNDRVLQHLVDDGDADRKRERRKAVGLRAEPFFSSAGGKMGRERIAEDAIRTSRLVRPTGHRPEPDIVHECG